MSDTYGRTRTLAFASFLFCAGALTMACASSFGILVVGRLCVGVGLGFGLSIDPLYIAEITPPKYRGFFVSWSEFAINLGILLGFFAAYALESASNGWRLMLGAGGVLPIVMFFLALFVMPETPRYLVVRKAQREKALGVLRRLFPSESEAERTLKFIEESAARDEQRQEGWSSIFKPQPGIRLMLLVVVVSAMAQQLSGVECFMYYVSDFFCALSFDSLFLSAFIFTSHPFCLNGVVLSPGKKRF